MRATTIVAAAMATAFSVASAATSLSGSDIPAPERTCSPTGTKCAGATDHAFVTFKACCDANMVCGTPITAGATWGRFCAMPSEVIPSSTMLPTTSVTGNGTTGAGAAGVTTGGVTPAMTTTMAGGATTTKVGGAGAFGNTSADGMTTTKPVNGSKPTNGTSGNSSSSCFPASSTVELQDGSVVRMDALSIGDMVKVSSDEFSRVFMFTHKLAESVNEFVVLSTSSGETLTVTSGHYIYINGVLSAASEAAVGSTLRLGSGASTTVTTVSSTVSTGLFNSQTTHGDIVVDGIVSSTYTTAVEPTVAHALLAPFRALYALTGFEMTAFESGAAALVGLAPRGTTAAL